ncbi:hypothetical protein GGR57DRAFT_468670 [Xylariaceae sp. FL1272]|nr:hypothetical protein GGR57DRAFT_468670 [Xylariaceae sp. FL1272]
MSDLAEKFHSLPPEQQQALLNGPALAPPPGVTSNFENPPNKNTLCSVVITIGFVVTAILLLSRAYSRLFCIKKLYLEDVLIIIGYGLYIAYNWAVYRLLELTGLFVHQWDIQLRTVIDFEYFIYIGSDFAGAAILFIRTAIILDWIRIFVPKGTRNAFFWTSHVLLWLVITFYSALFIAEDLSCIPSEKIWNPLVLGGSCSIDQQLLIIVLSSANLVADLSILLLPQLIIWRLQMSRTKKAGLSVIFAIAVLNVVVAGIRIATSVGYLHNPDSTYQVGTVILAGFAELTLLLMVACVPSVPKTFNALPKHYSSIASALRGGKSQSDQTSYSGTHTRYEQIDEHGLEDMIGRASVDPESARPKGSIVRTTDFTTVEGSVDSREANISDANHLRQHPWITLPEASWSRK